MWAELPKITSLTNRLIGQPTTFDLVYRIVRVLFEIYDQLVDFGGRGRFCR